jgi:beta-phosphoglucomutase
MQNTTENTNASVACLFDLDGVLVDTAVYHFKAWLQLANSLGFDFTQEQNEQLKGINRMQSLDKILAWGGVEKSLEEKEKLAAQKNGWYVAMINKMSAEEVLPGSIDLLESLKASGIKIALGSASKNSAVILERCNLTHYFDAIVDGNVVSTSKPHPEVFLKGAELLGVTPEASLVFEDAQAGIDAALAGNMKVVGVGEENNLKGAHFYVKDLAGITVKQILELLGVPAV